MHSRMQLHAQPLSLFDCMQSISVLTLFDTEATHCIIMESKIVLRTTVNKPNTPDTLDGIRLVFKTLRIYISAHVVSTSFKVLNVC